MRMAPGINFALSFFIIFYKKMYSGEYRSTLLNPHGAS